jgi:hypothetical protein
MMVRTIRHKFLGLESCPEADDLIHAIANTITAYFTRGIIAGEDIIFFADSTLGVTDEKDIARLLTDSDWYGDALRDLVFAPTPFLRIAIEMMIPPEGLSGEACKDICGLILSSLKNTCISFGKSGHSIMVNISGAIIARFLGRLNLNKRVILPLVTDTASAHNQEFCARARVIMRNARYRTSPEREKFLSEMIGRMISDKRFSEETITDCLVFMLSLFEEFGDDSDVYSLISEKKRSFDVQLSDIADYQEYAQRYSMDYLMSQRIHRPAIDHEDIMKKIYLSDLICMSVYDRPADSGKRS